jgi:hypothetical protein
VRLRAPEIQALVANAVAIIGFAADHTVIERETRTAREYIARSSKEAINRGYYGAVTKEQKKAASVAATAFRKLRWALQSKDLARRFDQLKKDDLEQFEEWEKQYEQDAIKPSRPRSVRAFDQGKQLAAEYAARILQNHGQLSQTTKLVRLAALMYGSESADLRQICREVRKRLEETGKR